MESLTKRRLERGQIDAFAERALGLRVQQVEELPEGMFNAVYRVYLDSDRVPAAILKSSPPAHVPLLTYERDIMRTEAAFYRLAAAADLPVPKVLAVDFSRTSIDGDLMLLSHLDGDGWHRMHQALSTDDESRLRRDVATLVARLHQTTGTMFGYFQPGAARATTWRAAFLRMVDDLVADADRFGVTSAVDPHAIRETLASRAALLDAVRRPALVHFDLWEGNILLAERAGRYEISGFIDGERAMWADPFAELASVKLFGDIADDPDFREAYGCAAISPDVAARIAMYKAYLDLIMIVETGPRGYDPQAHAPVLDLAYEDLKRSLARLTALD